MEQMLLNHLNRELNRGTVFARQLGAFEALLSHAIIRLKRHEGNESLVELLETRVEELLKEQETELGWPRKKSL